MSINTVKALALWKQCIDNLHNVERCCLDLLAHPDTTPEQLVLARKTLMDLRANIEENYPLLLDKCRGSFRKPAVPHFMEPR